MKNKILITGGFGYIGSHTIVELATAGYEVVVIDNFSNCDRSVIKKLETLIKQKIVWYEGDVQDRALLRKIFKENKISAAMHFAGLKAVGESVEKPLAYYRNNIDSTLSLCEIMQEFGANRLIFSSSATVYGEPAELPLNETSRTGVGITNPYGQTKFMIEQILRDMTISDPKCKIITLRYFNPIGAHASGLIGENPHGTPSNLLPYVAQVAAGKIPHLQIYGDDYDTPDGTGVRDYIHVVDLAKGHMAALRHLESTEGMDVYNLGTGQGTSVMEVIKAFEKASGAKIPYKITARRAGDIATCYANPAKANRELGWRAERTVGEACEDVWRWQEQYGS